MQAETIRLIHDSQTVVRLVALQRIDGPFLLLFLGSAGQQRQAQSQAPCRLTPASSRHDPT
ncbi:MAG TPA: hypothetical protein DG814_10240 [Synechococcus sp. UBA9887]|nr:hypothetical protein [Synechococcus sp. UBA9887]